MSDTAATRDWMHLRSYNSGRNHIICTGLGLLSDGSETQDMKVRESKITADIYTPSIFNEARACNLEPTDEIDNVAVPSKTRPGYREIRQIKTFQGLTDVIVISQWEFKLRFYPSESVLPKKNGFYGTVGEPSKVYKFTNPNPPKTTRFQIILINRGAPPKIDEFRYEEATDT